MSGASGGRSHRSLPWRGHNKNLPGSCRCRCWFYKQIRNLAAGVFASLRQWRLPTLATLRSLGVALSPRAPSIMSRGANLLFRMLPSVFGPSPPAADPPAEAVAPFVPLLDCCDFEQVQFSCLSAKPCGRGTKLSDLPFMVYWKPVVRTGALASD